MKNFGLLLFLMIIVSCNNEPIDSNPFEGNYNVFGKILAPNGTDPISKVNVNITSENNSNYEIFSDARGNFSTNLSHGVFSIEFKKGLFKANTEIEISEGSSNLSIDLGDIIFGEIPNIAVVTGSYDNIESILYDIGLVDDSDLPLFDIIDGSNSRTQEPIDLSKRNHLKSNKLDEVSLEPNVDFNFSDLLNDINLMSQYDIIFLNCGLDTSDANVNDTLYDYVYNGGLLYATDWAYPFLERFNEISGNDYLTFYQPYQSGESLSTEATILSSELNDWLSFNFNLTIENSVIIDEFLNSWQVVDTYDLDNVIAWLSGEVEFINENNELESDEKELAFTYSIGDGGIFYSSFHTENHDAGFSNVDRVMEFLVFELSEISD